MPQAHEIRVKLRGKDEPISEANDRYKKLKSAAKKAKMPISEIVRGAIDLTLER